MIVSHQHKFLFIHIQKTAGTSVSKFLKNNIEDAQDYLRPHSPLNLVDNQIYLQYYKVAFVRNPFDRLVSWYSMIAKNQKSFKAIQNIKNTVHKQVLMNSSTFSEFIFNCEHVTSNSGWKPFHKNQVDYITDNNGRIDMDFIGKFESLDKDFQAITKYLNIQNITLPHVNRTDHKDYRHYYTDETKKIITERFAKDLDYFQYEY